MLSRRQHLDCDQPRIHRAHPQAFMAGMHEKVLSTPFSKQSLQINFREDNRQAACARTMWGHCKFKRSQQNRIIDGPAWIAEAWPGLGPSSFEFSVQLSFFGVSSWSICWFHGGRSCWHLAGPPSLWWLRAVKHIPWDDTGPFPVPDPWVWWLWWLRHCCWISGAALSRHLFAFCSEGWRFLFSFLLGCLFC